MLYPLETSTLYGKCTWSVSPWWRVNIWRPAVQRRGDSGTRSVPIVVAWPRSPRYLLASSLPPLWTLKATFLVTRPYYRRLTKIISSVHYDFDRRNAVGLVTIGTLCSSTMGQSSIRWSGRAQTSACTAIHRHRTVCPPCVCLFKYKISKVLF